MMNIERRASMCRPKLCQLKRLSYSYLVFTLTSITLGQGDLAGKRDMNSENWEKNLHSNHGKVLNLGFLDGRDVEAEFGRHRRRRRFELRGAHAAPDHRVQPQPASRPGAGRHGPDAPVLPSGLRQVPFADLQPPAGRSGPGGPRPPPPGTGPNRPDRNHNH